MNVASALNHIPPSLKPFLQDVDFEALDPEHDAPTLIERTLAEGNVAEIRWLFTRYGVERITRWVKRRGAHRLPRDRRALWHILLGLELAPEKASLWKY